MMIYLVNFQETNVWSDVNASGTAPSARDKMASAVIGNDIYIFGGFGPKSAEEEVGRFVLCVS